MSWSYEDHTADLYLTAEADSAGSAIADAGRGLLELLWGGPPPPPTAWRETTIDAGSWEFLLVDFLNEILFRFDAGDDWPVAVAAGEPHRRRLDARIGTAPRTTATPAGREVKAASLRDLELAPDDHGRWHARVLLDL